LPASDGFLLAGGGALLASGLSVRPTRDLDFFGEQGRANVGEMRRQFLVAASDKGWKCKVTRICRSSQVALFGYANFSKSGRASWVNWTRRTSWVEG
jgi:hypothetical protein